MEFGQRAVTCLSAASTGGWPFITPPVRVLPGQAVGVGVRKDDDGRETVRVQADALAQCALRGQEAVGLERAAAVQGQDHGPAAAGGPVARHIDLVAASLLPDRGKVCGSILGIELVALGPQLIAGLMLVAATATEWLGDRTPEKTAIS
ncbi:MAG: hypothetical protein JWN85_1050 [Gammaproteobacteria bacterium]|nr:hypothetical protein [Gammaproteobacteria bacterium]